MEPASSIITLLGGSTKVASICGVHRTRPWKWTQPKEDGGTGGLIPTKYAEKIIAAGKAVGCDIPDAAFLPGFTGKVAVRIAARRKAKA